MCFAKGIEKLVFLFGIHLLVQINKIGIKNFKNVYYEGKTNKTREIKWKRKHD
jgi:hypothetical protein